MVKKGGLSDHPSVELSIRLSFGAGRRCVRSLVMMVVRHHVLWRCVSFMKIRQRSSVVMGLSGAGS